MIINQQISIYLVQLRSYKFLAPIIVKFLWQKSKLCIILNRIIHVSTGTHTYLKLVHFR